MESIFVSYRRDDSAEISRLIAGKLMARFGKRNVFIDIDSIAGGEPFPQRLHMALAACEVVVIVIGPGWLSATDAYGRRRLLDPGDFVRQEVEAALGSGKSLFPVLVGGAALPHANELPPSLQGIVRWPPYVLPADSRFASELARLLDVIRCVRLVHALHHAKRIPYPVFAGLVLALLVTGIPYFAYSIFRHDQLQSVLLSLDDRIAGPLFLVLFVVMLWRTAREKYWGWLAAILLLFAALFFPFPHQYADAVTAVITVVIVVCMATFSVFGQRLSLRVALARTRSRTYEPTGR